MSQNADSHEPELDGDTDSPPAPEPAPETPMPASLPASPYAIDRLVASVDGLRDDVRKIIERLEANYTLLFQEFRIRHDDHEARITKLEYRPKTAASFKKKSKKK